ncbi:sensitivity to high expression protein she9 [Actinomortierella wolfii]|nr:sensitivity to high expression protein she9 [Actinomortierella wolfii]
MLAHHARITSTRNSVLMSSFLRQSRCSSLVHRTFSTTCIRENKEDGLSGKTSGANGSSDPSKPSTSSSTTPTTPSSTTPSNSAGVATSSSATTSTTPTSTLSASHTTAPSSESISVTDAERKRAEERDATLKEILESAAAEARSLERERLAEEARRKAALEKKAAEEKARKEELERIKAAAIEAAVSEEPVHTSTTEKSSSSSEATLSSVSSKTRAGAGSEPLENVSQASVGSSASYSPANGGKAASTEYSTFSHDPLKDFGAKLLPYKKSLQSSTEYLRSSILDSLRDLSGSIKRKDYQDMISQLARHLNTLTGYNAIDKLKRQVISHGDALDASRIKLVQAKHAYEEAIATRSNTQKAINDLLQRKHLWSPNDVIRFTDLYRSEHANEQAEIRAKEAYRQAEEDVEEKSRKLTTVIMERYHGEQVWSDKIRAASTYGTWGLVCVNVMAFLIVQAFVEPRRRRKQIERYEELVQDLTDRGILPSKENADGTTAAAVEGHTNNLIAGSQADAAVTPVDVSGEDDKPYSPAAAANALDGGVDILERLVQLAQDQEARLARMEAILTGQDAPPAIAGAFSETEKVEGTGEDVVITDDGTILLVHYGDGLEVEVDSQAAGPEAEAWPDQLAAAMLGRSALRHAQQASSSHSDDQRAWTERIKGLLTSSDDPVLMKKRDYWISGLGGAILGSIVTGLIVLASNR